MNKIFSQDHLSHTATVVAHFAQLYFSVKSKYQHIYQKFFENYLFCQKLYKILPLLYFWTKNVTTTHVAGGKEVSMTKTSPQC